MCTFHIDHPSKVNTLPLVSCLLALEVEATGLVGSYRKISIIAVEATETF